MVESSVGSIGNHLNVKEVRVSVAVVNLSSISWAKNNVAGLNRVERWSNVSLNLWFSMSHASLIPLPRGVPVRGTINDLEKGSYLFL